MKRMSLFRKGEKDLSASIDEEEDEDNTGSEWVNNNANESVATEDTEGMMPARNRHNNHESSSSRNNNRMDPRLSSADTASKKSTQHHHQDDGASTATGDEDERMAAGERRHHQEEHNAANYDEYDDASEASGTKAKHIETSAGTNRLNRILRNTNKTLLEEDRELFNYGAGGGGGGGRGGTYGGGDSNTISNNKTTVIEKVSDPKDVREVGLFCGRVVVPALKVHTYSIGGSMLDGYPDSMVQESLLVSVCQTFESTGADSVILQALQYPNDYSKHKRSLGLFASVGGTKGGRSNKVRYVLLARSTNRPLLKETKEYQKQLLLKKQQEKLQEQKNDQRQDEGGEEGSDRGDYDAMFAPEEHYDDASKDLSANSDELSRSSIKAKQATSKIPQQQQDMNETISTTTSEPTSARPIVMLEEEEISSFPVLICMTLHSDGTGPDIRKLIPLDQLTTVQDLSSSVVQLAFSNGDTIRLDFGDHDESNKVVERPLDKERFLWSLLQIHAMLCMAVVERNSLSLGTMYLPPLNVRNLDRAELQYVATVNGFLKKSKPIKNLLERQRKLSGMGGGGRDDDDDNNDRSKSEQQQQQESKFELGEMDEMAYDLMMGNFATRVTLFYSEDERKDAEEILNAFEWTDMLSKEATAAVSVAERLGFMLQSRMRDLEAETCRRLIAWEDEKHLSLSGRAKLHDETDSRDTVDALALAALFKTLESLDSELKSMEEWLQDRAAAIKPLTDDCADIEEENRQLEQQWKSYDMLGAEMRRLLQGLEIDDYTMVTLKNPASALVYDEEGLVDVDESDEGIEKIYDAGKTLLDAIEFPRKSGGMHLQAVAERAKGLTKTSNIYCSGLAQIIVTVMEQFKTETIAGSDFGKVSKNDTHTMIAKKIRETQRKFQSSLLGYIKLIEILAALNPDMLPALRDAYAEMVAEGILMKKRMKGYFQALPGKNAAYLSRAGKDLKDYAPHDDTFQEETVNAPDIRAVLSELLPVIAREAYFTSALFGSNNRDQDGREKKRNFENAKNAVDKASTHFKYYANRTCGIITVDGEKNAAEANQRVDPLLCVVATIYLNESMENYIDREKKGGDHSLSLAYVRATILDLRKKADKQWVAWVDKQLEWIRSSDGVPLTGKRAGIFPSFARFPLYLDHLVMCCKEGRDSDYEPDLPGIKVINYYLQKMAVALLESLKECANRETTDQSYAANVMQMENTYYFTQAVKNRGPKMEKMFAKQVVKANAICKESTDAYLGWMIKREFTILHELFSRVSKIRKELGDKEVVSQVPKSQFVKTLQKEANRDILKEKISSMFSRMEKHLSEEGDLLPVAWKALVKVLYEWFGRWEKLCTSIYRHKLDPSPVDVVRIAKAAGGAAKQPQQAQGSDFGFKNILALGNKPDQK